MECLFRFFSYGLETKFRPELYKDFQTETLKDCEAGQLYGLEKFWAFTKYYKHAEELHVQPQLKAKLEPFNTIEDFKVLYTVSIGFFSGASAKREPVICIHFFALSPTVCSSL